MFAVIIYTPLCLGLPAFYNQKWEGNGKQAVWICCYIFLNLNFLFFLLLNHKNTLIYLWSIVHILASLKKKLQPVILLWNVFSVECLFLFWSVWLRPLPVYPIVFNTLGCQLLENTVYCSHESQQTSWATDRRFNLT